MNEVRYCGMVLLPMMRPRARNQNRGKIGFTQWNLMKQRLLFIGKALASYSKKNSFAVFNEFLVPHHVKRFDVSWWVGWSQIYLNGKIQIC